ncbi:putative bcas2 family protein [Rosellinia necatrix]|uniref:Putative bcas2 family protein n=1 Tax=Rosellinia necatrix TaxID=77044 RepID=A0A1W2TRQ3_ROSNE|nr:putative bcas2 family protein [Rosellinia necatrix]
MASSSIHGVVHESLPYIDKDPTPAERSAAESLIAAEQRAFAAPSLPARGRPASFTPALAAELERVSSKRPLDAIDLARYEAQDALPTNTNTTDTTNTTTTSDLLLPPLSRAYASHAYLRARESHLRLLDAYGRNAWLVGNWQAEADLAALERDLAAARRDVDLVNLARRRLQDDVADELRGLEDTWKKGVGRVLETEVATEALRQQVLERRRVGGSGGGGGGGVGA